ncbi:protein-L-isoaspartate(D-aspartate) O-methyltransferase [Saccharopolyspora spinosa]|uniref:Protein-L-isoaspartate O-methyltransferase n=1 Tax=Saccharopolyspora spinosa TaxID=60894 RepID=A0A2N3Y1K2_SACSN|nr:protein-L-isoaspartate(D-aspartate) O-methyltransferase [Saccharopolyspora spinosa]
MDAGGNDKKTADSLSSAESNSPALEHVKRARDAMIEQLRDLNALRSDRVAAVFRTVDRHAFAPGVLLDEVYAATTAVKTKWDEHGAAVSSISAPQIQAFMLEQASVQPGMRVLEVGSGGVNAAMLAELVGESGSVTTMDIDPEITCRARKFLDTAGYSRVRVVCGDAEEGIPDGSPFDVVLVTVGCWDIPPAWSEQLIDGGRLVVPLRMRGITRSLSVQRTGDHLVSDSAEVCGFVKIQGEGAHQERMLLLHGDRIALSFDDDTYPSDPHQLDGVLATDRADTWSGATVGGMEAFDSLPLWLATVLPGFCLLSVDSDYVPSDGGPVMAVEGGRWFPYAHVYHGDSFAYLASRRVRPGVFEMGAHGFGPHGYAAAEALSEQIRTWHNHYRHDPAPEIAIWPQDTPDDLIHRPETGGRSSATTTAVIDKRHTRISISWPPPTA